MLRKVGDLKLIDRSIFKQSIIHGLTKYMPDNRIDFGLIENTNSVANKITPSLMTSTLTMRGQLEMEVDCSIDFYCTAGDFDRWAPLWTQVTFRQYLQRTRMQGTAANGENPPPISFYPEPGWREQVAESCSDFFYNNQDPNRPNRPDTCDVYLTSMGDQTLYSKDSGIKIMGSFSDQSRFGLYFYPFITVVQHASRVPHFANSH